MKLARRCVYFHALFWPAILKSANYKTPKGVFANGFLTVNGKKMSKSRGTFIKARTYLDSLDSSYLRYYFASRLSAKIDDIDLNLEEFISKANTDIVGKIVNIASRCSGFIYKKFNATLSADVFDTNLQQEFKNACCLFQRRFVLIRQEECVVLVHQAGKVNVGVEGLQL